jgi:hypothetical protein
MSPRSQGENYLAKDYLDRKLVEREAKLLIAYIVRTSDVECECGHASARAFCSSNRWTEP